MAGRTFPLIGGGAVKRLLKCRDHTGRTRPLALRLLALLLMAQAIPVAVGTGTSLLNINLGCTYALAALGLSIIFGLGGYISIAQAAVMAGGGYTFILLFGSHIGLPLALILATLAGGIVSTATGIVGTRVKTHYFILISLAMAEIIELVLTNAVGVTGGSNGMALGGTPSLFGFELTNATVYFRLVSVLVAVVWYLTDSLRASRFGLALRAQLVDEYLALAAGIATERYRVAATAVGGLFGGLAGGLFAIFVGYLGPQDFSIDFAILLLLMVVIAGTGRGGSVIVAALILTYLSQGLLTLAALGKLIYGVGLVALILFAPDGLGGVPNGLRKLRMRAIPRRRQ